MLNLLMLPAQDGDCLVLRFGDPPKTILIDVGRKSAFEALEHVKELHSIDLLVITHVDADHVSGALYIPQSDYSGRVKAVWFNAHRQLQLAQKKLGLEAFGPAQGESFSTSILDKEWIWNDGYDTNIVAIPINCSSLIRQDFGACITLLSPTMRQLARFEPVWARETAKAGLLSGEEPTQDNESGIEGFGTLSNDVEDLSAKPDICDRTLANGSSISFVFEFEGKRILFAADAHPDQLEHAIRSCTEGSARYKVDLVKISHHGSKANTTKTLLDAIECSKFAFSTDGSRHGHPDPETIAKILKFSSPGEKKTLYFNYRSRQTEIWDDPCLMRDYNYECVFPTQGNGILEIEL